MRRRNENNAFGCASEFTEQEKEVLAEAERLYRRPDQSRQDWWK